MLKKANLGWNARQLCRLVQKGEIKFDNAVQRGLVWDVQRKSLLIHSMLSGYPIPPFYAVKDGGCYDMLDGKQRINAVVDFMEGKFELEGIPEVEAENEDGSTDMVDINTLYFDEMEESLRDELSAYAFTVYYFEDATDEEIAEMFFRLNNGKALSAIELTRVKAKSMDAIQEIGKHGLFRSALTEKAFERYTNEDIVIKSYAVLHEKEPSLETKYIRPYMAGVELTEEGQVQLLEIYDRILAVHGLVEDKKIARRILTRTHLVSIVPAVWQSIEEGRTEKEFAGWVSAFFAGKKSASVSSVYNDCAGSGSAKKDAVRKRLDEITRHYEAFFHADGRAVQAGKR